MAFAETTQLRIRGYKESDMDLLIELINDPRTQRANPRELLPRAVTKTKDDLLKWIDKALTLCILEAKEPLEDGSNWVGLMALTLEGSPKNRDVTFGIALDEKFWGRGFGEYR
jgi:RimJ/RimL family protein N-acetyltransferase